jgi:Inhibitor of apoptosis-promoting Bax1
MQPIVIAKSRSQEMLEWALVLILFFVVPIAFFDSERAGARLNQALAIAGGVLVTVLFVRSLFKRGPAQVIDDDGVFSKRSGIKTSWKHIEGVELRRGMSGDVYACAVVRPEHAKPEHASQRLTTGCDVVIEATYFPGGPQDMMLMIRRKIEDAGGTVPPMNPGPVVPIQDDLLRTRVFERKGGEDKLRPEHYNLLIGCVLFWGFAVNSAILSLMPGPITNYVHPVIFIATYLALCFYGVRLFNGSSRPLVSFLGYNMVVLPLGLLIDLMLRLQHPGTAKWAMAVTGTITLAMMTVASTFPAFFRTLRVPLLVALVSIIALEGGEYLFFGTVHRFLDLLAILVFCGYIGLDWVRANNIPRTVDNAIDSAAAIYIDIINLFILILRIMGRKR